MATNSRSVQSSGASARICLNYIIHNTINPDDATIVMYTDKNSKLNILIVRILFPYFSANVRNDILSLSKHKNFNVDKTKVTEAIVDSHMYLDSKDISAYIGVSEVVKLNVGKSRLFVSKSLLQTM